MTYDAFLQSKVQIAPISGFEVRPEDINPAYLRWLDARMEVTRKKVGV